MSFCSYGVQLDSNDLGDLYTESRQTSQCSFSSVSTPPIARVGAFFSIHIFSRSTRFALLRTFGVEVEKTKENHLVDPTEKAENAESSENVTDERYQKTTLQTID